MDELLDQYRESLLNAAMEHFSGGDWSTVELENLYGENVVNTEGMTDKQIFEIRNEQGAGIPEEDALREDMLHSMLDTLNTRQLQEYVASIGEEPSMPTPYEIVVFSGRMTDTDLNNPQSWTDNDIAEHVICQGEEQLLEEWKNLYEDNQGMFYAVSDGTNILTSGVMDINDLDYLEMLPVTSEAYKQFEADIAKNSTKNKGNGMEMV